MPRNHTPPTPPSRSDLARKKLLRAAIKAFALYGFEGASTRQITRDAGVNIAAIPYYFRDKAGLYRAVMEHIAEIVRTNVVAPSAQMRSLLDDPQATPAACRRALHDTICLFGSFLLSKAIPAAVARIFLREQLDPTPGFAVIYDDLMNPMHTALTHLIARCAGLPFPSEQATLCAHALLGQIVIFKTHQEAALRRLGWKKIGDAERDKIVATVLAQTDAVLDGLSRENGRKK